MYADAVTTTSSSQLQRPTLRTVSKTLYMPSIESLEVETRPNLKMTLAELGVVDGTEVIVADRTLPQPMTLIVNIDIE